jgi:hypothetical protein
MEKTLVTQQRMVNAILQIPCSDQSYEEKLKKNPCCATCCTFPVGFCCAVTLLRNYDRGNKSTPG